MVSSGDFDGFPPAPQAEPANDDTDISRGLSARVWSLMALVLGLGLTLWATTVQQQRHEAERLVVLEAVAEAGYAGLMGRLDAWHFLVRSVQTLFLTSQEVTAEEFAHLYANLQPRQRLPSMQALAYAQVQPGPGEELQLVTTLIAPAAGNERLVGLDVTRQPANLAAVLQSRDSDEPALSAPFRLIQSPDAETIVDGLTMRLPVFSPGPPPRTQAERRTRFRGSLAVSIRASSFIERALSSEVRETMHIEIVDVTDGVAQPLYDSHPLPHGSGAPTMDFGRDLHYGGRIWRMSMHPIGHTGTSLSWSESVLWPGLLASMLLALLVGSVAGTRQRALELGGRMSRRYRESEQRFRALNDLLPALVLLARAQDGRIAYANQAARQRLGDRVGDLELSDLFDDLDLRAQLHQGGPISCASAEAMLRAADGRHFWASVSIAQVELAGQQMLLMVASDISEQRELTQLLSFQASHDTLTELYNRREFERRLERALGHLAAGGPPAALLYVDLDQFKLINDTSGHVAGDQLLVQLAMMMRAHLRDGDVLARLGGDEFGVLANNVHDLDGAKLVAERLREQIDGHVLIWEKRSYTISASIGGVMLDHPNVTLKDLLAHADTACYIAKESGRNRVHFYSAQDDETARRHGEMEWANRLRWAIKERRLLLKYQEVFALGSAPDAGTCIEVLLRFRDEDGRLVAPGAFIPAAERYGLMPMIDRWVITTALANIDRLHPSGAALELININVSGASIEDDSFVDMILQQLRQHHVDPQRVCFEITETVAVRNLMQVTRFIDRLHEVGCRVALDDFGAGMSSFGYLKSLPVDIIKIDGSFIRDLLTDPMSHSIVRAVTEIGHQRQMLVIAEWVTSEETLNALVEIGVDYAQGFGLHRPQLVPFHDDVGVPQA